MTTATHAFDLAPYTPAPALDAELADLAYAATHSFSDQRPITPALVRSRLAAHGQAPPTNLASLRTGAGALIAAAALRHPSSPGGTGRLWGPLVRPGHQRAGLGRRLLHALQPHLSSVDGALTTTEVPDDRYASAPFFCAAGWEPAVTAAVFKAPLPLTTCAPRLPETVRSARRGEDLTRIDTLYAAARPDDPAATGAGARWSSDERYRPRCLALADDGNRLLAAALVYPLAHTRPGEPTEALLGDLLRLPGAGLDLALHTARLALAAAASTAGATVARAVIPETDLATGHLVQRLGLTAHARARYYQPGSA